ncbi:MAG: RluA family pseudouridine synthase [Clostridia bacterium]|nr:RluA family pseudouridine synthase [Clostridia bacterium]
MDYRVEEKNDGKPVRDVIKKELGISMRLLKHLKFVPGGILVNGNPVTVRYFLRTGDLLSVAVEDEMPNERLEPVCLPLEVIYEDGDLTVPNKPANMPTHPSCNHHRDTVANALAYRYESLGIPFVFRPVNRLDRNTSGLLLIARNRVAAATQFRSMQKGEIRKLYLAILQGVPGESEGLIETYMRRTAQSVILRENCGPDEGGDPARTRYRVLAAAGGYSLVCAAPLTGRTHQLRVHFAGLGCPLVGDNLYGKPDSRISRHALHSCVLSFLRCSDGERITLTAPLPEDMRELSSSLFGGFEPKEEELIALCREFTKDRDIPLQTHSQI